MYFLLKSLIILEKQKQKFKITTHVFQQTKIIYLKIKNKNKNKNHLFSV